MNLRLGHGEDLLTGRGVNSSRVFRIIRLEVELWLRKQNNGLG